MSLFLKTKTFKVKNIDNKTKYELFELFSSFYENVDFQIFLNDFQDKNKVIILLDKEGRAKGFSTIKTFNYLSKDSKKMRIFFTGDTIVHPDYWGKHKLHLHMALNMFIEKMKNPHKHNVWFLLTKGYKTYLLLTNNFSSYYPRYEKKTPQSVRRIIDSLGEGLFKKTYDKKTGTLKSSDLNQKDKLKGSIAPIDADLCLKVPKINFFQLKNPNWREGDELLCIGNLTFHLFFIYYPLKLIRKQLKKTLLFLGLRRQKRT